MSALLGKSLRRRDSEKIWIRWRQKPQGPAKLVAAKTVGVPIEAAALDELLARAEKESFSHLSFLDRLLSTEAGARRVRAVARRNREARFADNKTMEGEARENCICRIEMLAMEIVGALANLGHTVSDQTVGNILRRHGIAPVPERSRTTTWRDFIRRHMDVLSGHGLLHGRSADLATSAAP